MGGIVSVSNYNEESIADLLRYGAIFKFLSSSPEEVQANGFIKATGDYSDPLPVAMSVDVNTNRVTQNTHGLIDGNRVKFAGDVIPEPFEANTIYYVRNETVNDFEVSKWPESEILDITTVGTNPTLIKTRATDFCITAPEGKILLLARMLPGYTDGGSMDSGAYGNGIIITQGVRLINGSYKPGSEYEKEITEGLPIIDNTDWGFYVGPDSVPSNYGQGDESMNIRWTFLKMGRPVMLDGNVNEFACIRLNDDFTGLVKHYFGIQGISCNRKKSDIESALEAVQAFS